MREGVGTVMYDVQTTISDEGQTVQRWTPDLDLSKKLTLFLLSGLITHHH